MRGETVRSIGEFNLIQALEQVLPAQVRGGGELAIGIGDDAALWQPAEAAGIVVSTDSLVEGIHFRLDWTDWERLGHKTLAVNLSDIAAMGAIPSIALISLNLRGTERVADLQAFYEGLGALAATHGVKLAGGDVVASPLATSFHVTVLGKARAGGVLTRRGAKSGDLIGVSGTLGASAAGLKLLQSGGMNARRRAQTADLLIDAHLKPMPRVHLGELLLDMGASSAMDLSDGLLGDLPKLLAASGVRARLEESQIPVASAVRALFPNDWLQLALRGGEDYELLFTIAPAKAADLIERASSIGSTITFIGAVLPATANEPPLILRTNGVDRPVRSGAFDHFAG